MMGTSTDVLLLRLPVRFRIAGYLVLAAMIGVIALVAFLVWNIGASMALAFLLVPAVGLGFSAWSNLPAAFGLRTTQVDADGVLTRLRPWDRRRTRVQWSDVSGVWIAPVGQSRYLHVGLRDADPYVTGGSIRRPALSNMLEMHGTPVLVFLKDRDVEPALAAVERYTGGSVPLLDARPILREPAEPAAVPFRVYRAAPRNLVLPAALVLIAAGFAGLGRVTGLFSVGMFSIYLLLAAALLVLRLRGRTILDAPGLTIGLRHVPWHDIARIWFFTSGPFRWVQVVRHQGERLTALGLVDQPVRHPRYDERAAEVAAACVGRVETGRGHENPWRTIILIAFIPVALSVGQFVALDRPWENRSWWPGVEVATSTPDPCVPLLTDDARRLVPTGELRKHNGADDTLRQCWLGTEAPYLEVTVLRMSYGDFIGEAEEEFQRRIRFGIFVEPVPGLGDEAGVSENGALVTVSARRSNIVVQVSVYPKYDREYELARGTPGFAANQATATELTRRVIDAVVLR